MSGPAAVWAPFATAVDVALDHGRVAMRPGTGGWWQCDDRTVDDYQGAYRFVLDGDPLPDPRSAWQPDGVHGPSHTVDHAAFPWRDAAWRGLPLPSCVLYELHVGTFTAAGTFDAAIEHLDHLVDLGVGAIELLPVAEFPGRHGWGYDGVDLFAPHHAYGGPDGLKRLVDASHARGLAVVLDVVYNHLGPSGNHLARFGPYFSDRYHTPWGPAINLDAAGSHEVRRFLCDNAAQWLRDYHLDGLRLDAVHALFDQSALPFLEQLALEVEQLGHALGRTLWLIAESDLNDPRHVRTRDAHGFGLDAQWSDDLHHALHAVLTGERDGYYADFGSLADIAAAFEHTFVHRNEYVAHRDRRHGRPVDDLPQHRFVAFLQNHDQIGNRARGERLAALVAPARLFVAAALLLLGPFVPLLFQGEEWGATTPFPYFTDHDEPELGEAVRAGRRAEFAAFGWDPDDLPDPQSVATFAAAVLRWDERDERAHRALLDWHRQLITLRRRKARDAVTADRPARCRVDDQAGSIVLEHAGWLIAANLGRQDVIVAVPPTRLLVGSAGAVARQEGSVRVGPDAVAVLAPRAPAARDPRDALVVDPATGRSTVWP